MNTTAKALLASAALFAACITASSDVAYAQTGGLNTPIGSVSTCQVVSNVTISEVSGTITASGSASFKTSSYTASPEVNRQEGVSFTATGSSSTLGTTTWTFTGTRNGAVISANQTSSSFPATSTISFDVEATFSALPGKKYRSIGQVTLVNPNLKTFNPQKNESYTLTNTNLKLEDVSQPGVPVFTIPAMTVFIPTSAQEPTGL